MRWWWCTSLFSCLSGSLHQIQLSERQSGITFLGPLYAYKLCRRTTCKSLFNYHYVIYKTLKSAVTHPQFPTGPHQHQYKVAAQATAAPRPSVLAYNGIAHLVLHLLTTPTTLTATTDSTLPILIVPLGGIHWIENNSPTIAVRIVWWQWWGCCCSTQPTTQPEMTTTAKPTDTDDECCDLQAT